MVTYPFICLTFRRMRRFGTYQDGKVSQKRKKGTEGVLISLIRDYMVSAFRLFSMFGLDSHFIHHSSTFNCRETIDFDMYVMYMYMMVEHYHFAINCMRN